MNKLIILAAGHGGGDSGATGQATTEAVECIQIVNRAADKLRADGRFQVLVVPHEYNLDDEIAWVNNQVKNLDDGVAIEVHKNATTNAHGIEAWYYSGDITSQHIAQQILDGIMTVPDMPVSRGVKGDATNRWGRLGWVRDTNPWAVLLEMGFVSDGGDPTDNAADDRYAQGIYLGVLNLFELVAPAVPVPVPSVPAPASAGPTYRVFGPDGKQLGAYNTRPGAWNKYSSSTGAKIVNVSSGYDVTGDFVLAFRPVPAVPVTPSPSHPEYDPAMDKAQNERLTKLENLVASIQAFLNKIFK